MFLKRLKDPETAIFVNSGILIKLLSRSISHQAGIRDIFNVNLNALARVLHLFVGFGDILGIWQFYCHLAASGKHSIQARYRSAVASLTQLDPEYNKTGIWISAPHITDQLQLSLGVLIGVAVRSMGSVCQRLQRPIVAFEPAIDILAVRVVTNCRLCDSVLLCITN